MTLIEASFEVERQLAAISAAEGRAVRVVDVHSIEPSEAGGASVYLDLTPADANGGLPVFVSVDACALDRATLLAAFQNGGTRH
jgi:hypothetical protein